jgi:peptidoglycan hydrolase FlgJ
MLDLDLDPRLLASPATQMTGTRDTRDLASLKKSSQQFENLLLAEMFKAMRKAVPEGGLFEKSNATEMFQEMLDMETIKSSTAKQNLGIADEIYRQMSTILEKRR